MCICQNYNFLEDLELPPPPMSWKPKLREMVDGQLKEIERDTIVNQQVQSAVDSIISFGGTDIPGLPEEAEKVRMTV